MRALRERHNRLATMSLPKESEIYSIAQHNFHKTKTDLIPLDSLDSWSSLQPNSNMLSRLFLTIPLCHLLLTVFAGAQSPPVKVSIRTVALELKDIPTLYLSNKEGKGLGQVEVSRSRFSQPLPLELPEGRLFFSLDQPEEGTPPSKLVSRCIIPPTLSEALLLFVPNVSETEGEDRMHIFVLDDSNSKFFPGGAQVLNLYGNDVRFILGENRKALKPQQSMTVAMPEEKDDFSMAPLAFQFKGKDDKWVTASEKRFRFTPTIRYLVVTFQDPRTGRLRVQSFKDRVRLNQGS